MFTPSIVFLMIMNTLAASGSMLVALQASAFEAGDRLSPSTASAPPAAEIAHGGHAQQATGVAGAKDILPAQLVR